MSNFVIPTLLLMDGLVFALLAFFAHELGLDPNTTWGNTRYILMASGTVLGLVSLLLILPKKRRLIPFESIIRSETSKTVFLLGHLWTIVFVIYAWFITYGTFTKWDHTSNYYAQLADAFNHKHLYLETKPSEAILATPDPYNPIDRPWQEGVWDMSLYAGRFYLYWGPVPALLIAPIQSCFDVNIPDIYIDFFFYAGLVIINSLILLKLWRNFFPTIPARSVYICIPLIGLISPVLWALIPTTIYGTAIGAGHFFLMGGVYFILSALEQKPSLDGKRLFLAGLFWTCSAGSRAINTPSIIFLAISTAFWVAKILPKPFNWTRYIKAITPLFIPLIVGAVATGWYNWERFDSPLEFGMRYQITFFNLNKDMALTFQPDYFFLNFYVYILQPFRVASRFPFAYPIYTPDILDRFNIMPPKMFFAGRMTGLLFSAPFLTLSLVHFFLKKSPVGEKDPADRHRSYEFVIDILAGSSLMGILGLMFFFFGQMRYLVDVISQITLLAILGYWKIISIRQRSNSVKSKLSVSFANLLVILTIGIGLLLAVTSESSRLEKLNPLLLEKIANALTFQR